MKFWNVPTTEAVGKVLAHTLTYPDGRTAFRKGMVLTNAEVEALMSAGHHQVYAAELDAGDLDGFRAARRIGEAAIRPGLEAESAPTLIQVNAGVDGKAKLSATQAGMLWVDPERLSRMNALDGISFATLRSRSIVSMGEIVGVVKLISCGLAASVVAEVDAVASDGDGALIGIRPFQLKRVSVIYSGSSSARGRVETNFTFPILQRLEAYQTRLDRLVYGVHQGEDGDARLAELFLSQIDQGVEMIIAAGETSPMDYTDTLRKALIGAGAEMVSMGAPIGPGNQVTLAYLRSVPILGVPRCIQRSRYTMVDTILAALLTGERLTRMDIARFGHGGLLGRMAHGV